MSREIVERARIDESRALKAMWRARKEVFIDLMRWDLPVLDGQYEVDRFDDEQAQYLILLAEGARHRASARLLRTDRPHLLGELYPHLCAGLPPSGPTVREITRFCLDRDQRSAERRSSRDQIVTALAEHALATGITDYTGVAEQAWFEQVRQFGWACEALGQPVNHDGRWLTALQIGIDGETPERLRACGVHAPRTLSVAVISMAGTVL